MKQEVILGAKAREGLIKGATQLASAVVASLGPNGRNVIYYKNGEIVSTKDGVSIAKKFEKLKDPLENMGANMLKQASIKTGDKVGDGTTTSTLLASSMINLGQEYITKTSNSVAIKRDMEQAVDEVLEFIQNNIVTEISGQDQLKQIATISANNDEEIGELISQALEKAQLEGAIHLEESRNGETYLENVEGMQFNRGYKSPYMVTDNNTMTCVLTNPQILIYDGAITAAKDIIHILENVSKSGKSLLIIAEEIEGEALATLIVNKMRGTLKVCAVKAPDFGDRRKLILEDIAITTGATVVSPDKGMSLERFSFDFFGSAKLANIEKDLTTIVDGNGDSVKIQERAEELKSQIESSKTPFETEKLNERLSRFAGGVSMLYIGGNTEIEIKEKKDRAEDALHAAKAAWAEGIVPGGGLALLRARNAISNKQSIGARIIYEACSAPFKTILSNAGYDLEEVSSISTSLYTEDLNELWKGYNIKTKSLGNMAEEGIIDPFKVTKNALKNAVSVAGTLLLTEGVILDEEEENANPGVDPSMFM